MVNIKYKNCTKANLPIVHFIKNNILKFVVFEIISAND